MIILHGFWKPLNRDNEGSPGLILWSEDAIRALDITRKKVAKAPKKEIKNSTSKIQQPKEPERPNGSRSAKRDTTHPFATESDQLLSVLRSNSKKYSTKISKKQEHSKLTEEKFKCKTIEFFSPVPTWNDIPILSDYIKLKLNNYVREYEEQLRIITSKLSNLIPINLENQQGDHKLQLWKIHGLQLNINETLSVFDLVRLILNDPLRTKNIIIGDDLRFWFNVYSWIETQIKGDLVYPSILDANEVTKLFFQLQKSKKTKKKYIGWWNHRISDSFQSNITHFSQQIPYSARINVNNEYSISGDINGDINDDLLVKCSFPSHVVLNDYLLLMTNKLMRLYSNENIQQRILGYKKYSKNGYLERIITSLFSNDPGFALPSDEDTYWFVEQFNKWCNPGHHENIDDQWNMCIQIIPPEDDISDDWGISYFLRHKLDNKSMLSVFQIFDTPNEPIVCGNYILEKPLQTFTKKISLLAKQNTPVSGIINQENPLYHLLSKNQLDLLLALDDKELRELGCEILLPRSIKNKFIPKNQISLQVDVNVEANHSSNPFLNYDLKVLIDGTEIALDEILKLADARSNLVTIAGKWIHFDAREARKIQQLLKQRLSKREIFDVIRLEAGDYSILGDENGGDFSIKLQTSSNINKLKKFLSAKQIAAIQGLNAELRPYQEVGLNWILNLTRWGFSGCLADDMGLGKTIQALAAIQYLKNTKQIKRPILIVAPTSVLGNWIAESDKFTPNLNINLHHGSKRIKTITRLKKDFRGQDIILTSYAILRIDSTLLGKIKWSGIILDEAQKIKNPNTNSYKFAISLSSDFRLALTGTPIENRLSELWSIFNFLLPNYLGSLRSFKDKFIIPIERNYDDEKLELLRKLIYPFIISRKKTDKKIIQDLPNKIEKAVYCPMSKEQIALYHATMEASFAALEEAENIKRRGIILATIGKLKQICNHPSNFLKDKDHEISHSGKLQTLIELLELIIASGEKVLIFSQYKLMCSLIHTVIKEKYEINSLFLHGGVQQDKRQKMIDLFNSDPLSNNIFIISLKAGGLGLNLTAATHVIHYDRWWNPAVENQATDRAYRIGQTQNVMVHKFITKGTIEEQIDKIITEKTDLVEKFMGNMQKTVTELDNDELVELMKLRDTTISNETI